MACVSCVYALLISFCCAAIHCAVSYCQIFGVMCVGELVLECCVDDMYM